MLGDKEYKEKTIMSRSDIAGRLRYIADAVEHGSFTAGEMRVTVPEKAKLEIEIEPTEVELEIKWR